MSKNKNMRLVRDQKRGIVWKWYGGHAIHGYRGKKELYLLNTGDFAKEELTLEEALAKMHELVQMPEEEVESYRIE